MTRASVTVTSSTVMLARLWPMRHRLGTAKAGMPIYGARYESACQAIAKTVSERIASRGSDVTRSEERGSSRDIDDRLVRHLRMEAGLHGALEHIPDHLALTLP